MGIEAFKGGVESDPGIRNRVDKLDNPRVCPECGEEAKLLVHRYDDKCVNDDCDVITFTRTSFSIDYSKYL